MAKKSFTDKYLASQVAGSCRLEGIRVSREDEQMMTDIIAGKVDAAILRKALSDRYLAK